MAGEVEEEGLAFEHKIPRTLHMYI